MSSLIFDYGGVRYGFAHVVKCAGTWMEAELATRGLGERMCDDPASCSVLRAYEADIVFATVRPPWTWYTSLWHFAMARPGGHTWVAPVIARYGLTGPAPLFALTDPATFGVGVVPDFGIVVTRDDITAGRGLWSVAVRQILGLDLDGADWVLDLKQFDAAVDDAFARIGLVGPRLAPVNRFRGGERCAKLPETWWAHVARVDGEIAGRLGYRSAGRELIVDRPPLVCAGAHAAVVDVWR